MLCVTPTLRKMSDWIMQWAVTCVQSAICFIPQKCLLDSTNLQLTEANNDLTKQYLVVQNG